MSKATLLQVIIIAAVGCGGETDSMNHPMSPSDGGIFGDHILGRTQVGGTQIVPPGPAGSVGPYMKILNASTEDKYAIPVTVNVRSEYTVDAAGAPLNFGAPLVAKVRWGVGGAYNVIEFDVPAPRVTGLLQPVAVPAAQPVNDIGNGALIQLSGSAFEVQIRNDSRLGPLVAAGNPAAGSIGNNASAKVMAFVTPGGEGQPGPLRRTLYIAAGAGAPNVLAPGANALLTIPMFARRVWFFRIPNANTLLTVDTFDNINGALRTTGIPVNSEGPIELHGSEVTMRLTNNSAVDITNLQAVFDLDCQF